MLSILCLNISYRKLSHQVGFTRERQKVPDFEHPPSLPPVGLALDRGEVVYLGPVVIPGGQAGSCQVLAQLAVVVLETAHCDGCAALYDGLAVDTEEHVHLQTVPQPTHHSFSRTRGQGPQSVILI